MKRFWRDVSVVADGDLFAVLLDGRKMRLPGGPLLRLRQKALAEAIGEEWRRVGANLSPQDVPLTALAGTAQERIARDPKAAAAAIAAYGSTDLLCYRAATPEALAARQEREWQGWLHWAASRFGARLKVTAGIMPVTQDPSALAALGNAVSVYAPAGLAGLGVIVPALGSLVLGLAVAEARLEPGEAHRLSILDELFEEETWGADAEKIARRERVGAEIEAAAFFMRLAT